MRPAGAGANYAACRVSGQRHFVRRSSRAWPTERDRDLVHTWILATRDALHEEAASAVRAGLKAHAAEMADPARSLGDLAGLAAVTVS